MFGVFKKLFSRTAAPATKEQAAPAPAPAAPRPAAPPPRSAPPAAPSPPPTQRGDTISLPLNEILSRMPGALGPMILSRPGGTFSFSASIIWEQLRSGAVRVPFGQLRQGTPPGTFTDDDSHDDSLIDLPLPLILAAIGPGPLSRRPSQKRITVPDDVTGIFGGNLGANVRVASPVAAPVAARPPGPSPVPSLPSTPRPLAPAPAPIPAPAWPRPAAPAAPFSAAPKPTTSIAPGPAAPKASASVPLPKASSPLPFAAARPAPRPASAAPAPAPSGESVATTIRAVCGSWPDAIRREIEQFGLGNAGIAIPLSRLEPAMKSGRVLFTWADVCGWLGGPQPPASPNGGSEVELPLAVIAPLFMAKHRPPPPRKIVSAGENVPNLFAKPGRLSALPAAPAVASPAAPPVRAAEPDALGTIFGQPFKRDWTPQEIARQILAMPGVAGALLATSDGLLVAGQTPAPVKAETLAAFVPQIFARAGGCAEEAQLGALRALTLAAGQAPCAIYKAGALYLAVLGKPGQALPEPALGRVAGQLAKQNH